MVRAFRYLPLVWAGLTRNRARLVLTLCTIVLAFFLFGLLRGLVEGYRQFAAENTSGTLRVFNRSSRGFGLPLAHRDLLLRLDGVTDIAYASGMGAYYQTQDQRVWVDGINGGALLRMDKRYSVSEAHIAAFEQSRIGVLAGADVMEKYGLEIGDRIPIVGYVAQENGSTTWEFDIVGVWDITPEGWTANGLLANYEYFDESRAAQKGTVWYFQVAIEDAGKAGTLMRQIDEEFRNSPTPTRTSNSGSEAESQLARMGKTTFFIDAVAGTAFLTILIVTGGALMQSMRERIPEFAVLKAYGYGDGLVSAIAAAEGVAMCVIGAIVGLTAAAAAVPVMKPSWSPPVFMPTEVFGIGLVLAVALGILATGAPLVHLRRSSLAESLAGR